MSTTPPVLIPPAPGRVLWFHPGPLHALNRVNDQPMAATVAHVHDDRLVNLSVVDHLGVQWPMVKVQLLQEADAPPDDGRAYASWMPYQLGQAVKHA